MRIMRGALAGLTLCLLLPCPSDAQDAPLPPAITVAPFSGIRSDKDANALADELAMRLVETGRFRVLTREWVPLPRRNGRPSIDAIRHAAVSAGVQYVVTAEARPASRPVGSVARPQPMPVLPFSRGRGPLFVPMMTRAPRGGADRYVSVTVRVLDAQSGEVVRTATGTGAGSASGRRPSILLVASLLARLGHPGLGAMMAVKPPSRSPLNTGAVQAIAEIAPLLTLPAPAGADAIR